MARKLAALLLVSFLLTGCAADPPYFEVPDEVSVTLPAEPGATVYVGLADLRTDDLSVTLVDLDPNADEGLDIVGQWVVRRSDAGGGGIGIAAESDVPEELLAAIGSNALSGYRLTPADGDVQVVLAVRAPTAGIYRLGPAELAFRVNDAGTRRQMFPISARLCIATPAPAECGQEPG